MEKITNYSDYIYIGLELQTIKKGCPFKITNIHNKIRIKNSQNNEYIINQKKLENYILNKDFNDCKGHNSYEPSLAKYIVEQLEERKTIDNFLENYVYSDGDIDNEIYQLCKLKNYIEQLIKISKRDQKDRDLDNSKI
ncbi:hypothetical protein NRK67_16605 (plasmid) [Fusobacteria bacterium ZRK30]|nr:hypothetical protein NRK67_16605 [Fusobacteria bacterium ZRK30]